MKAHALHYAARGWHVFPLEAGDKIPLKGTRGHLDATTDPAVITQWWDRYPSANIGIAVAPSGLTVLDVDVGQGKQGLAALAKLHAIVPLTDTLHATTGGGGHHFIYSRPEGVPAQRKIDFLQHLIKEEGQGSGLDLLGDGYFVAAPSTHKSGGVYAWTGATTTPTPLPEGLGRVYTAPKLTVERPQNGVVGKVTAGGRDNALFRLGCALADTGLHRDALHGALYQTNQDRCDPPMEDHEVTRIVDSVFNRVKPSRDVLLDTQFAERVLPPELVAQIFEDHTPLEVDDGHISCTLDQLAKYIPPTIHTRPTTIPKLNALLGGGFAESDLTLLIAPPGAGKSSFAISECLASTAPSLFVSAELDSREMRARCVAQKLKCTWLEVMKGQRSAGEIARALSGSHMRIIGCEEFKAAGASVVERLQAICLEIAKIQAIHGVAPTVVFDYVQIMARGKEDEKDPVGTISATLSAIARHFRTVVIAVSSTSRTWYGEHPEIKHAGGFLAAGKESGQLEYDAATVLYLDCLGDTSKGYQSTRIAAAKCRHGQIGFAGARYEGARGGLWEGDDSCLEDFDVAKRSEGERSSRMSEDEKAILKKITESGPDPKGVLQHNCGIPATRAKAAIIRLLEAGRLEVRKESRIDVNHRQKSVEVVAIVVP